MKWLPFLIFFSFLSSLSSHGIEGYGPSYAGTQLAFYPTNVDPGHVSVQPYLFMHHHYGFYKRNWSSTSRDAFNRTTLQLSLETGIFKSLDFQVNTHVDYSRYQGQHSILCGDIRSYFGWQISREEEGTWIPNSRLLFGESFPTGKYDNLDPKKRFSDISSSGAFETVFILVVAKTFMSFPAHPFNLNLNLFYILPSKVDVKGINAYGGSANTKGTVEPGA